METNTDILEKHFDDFFLVYTNCFYTRGINKASIFDVDNCKIFTFDISYNSIIKAFKKKNIRDIILELEENSINEFYAFISFLYNNKLGTFVSDISLFPPIKIYWDTPSEITNSIIDIDSIAHNYIDILSQLIKLRCKYIIFRCFRNIEISRILEILTLINESCIVYVKFIFVQQPEKDYIQEILNLTSKYTFAYFIFFNINEINKHTPTDNLQVKLTTDKLNLDTDCGFIDKNNFIISDINSYMENRLFNSCLNRKICIDKEGYIKNCPFFKKSYGHISKEKLIDVARNNSFREMWYINKDDIKICKLCEYRSVCSDCRAYLSDPDDLYSKPKKCAYDPFTSTWNN